MLASQVNSYIKFACDTVGMPEYYGMIKWRWSNAMVRCAGKAWSGRKLIKLSLPIFNARTEEENKKTIIHETLHVLADNKHMKRVIHGYEWKRMMIQCGLTPDRCHSFDTTVLRPHKWVSAKCGCVEGAKLGVTQARRLQAGVSYGCKKCKQKISL